MKRPLLLAAVLAAAPLMAGTAKAEPLQMFNIVTPSAGVVNFSGTGTANFNQSLGTTNNVNLGSSTNVGVNASASSTSDYTSSGFAKLDLDGSSRLQQTIGTAAQAFNTNTAAEAASRSATTSAFEKANKSSYGVEWTSSGVRDTQPNLAGSTKQQVKSMLKMGWLLKANAEVGAEGSIKPKLNGKHRPSRLGKLAGKTLTTRHTPTPTRHRLAPRLLQQAPLVARV